VTVRNGSPRAIDAMELLGCLDHACSDHERAIRPELTHRRLLDNVAVEPFGVSMQIELFNWGVWTTTTELATAMADHISSSSKPASPTAQHARVPPDG
jgi:hypothetical protein